MTFCKVLSCDHYHSRFFQLSESQFISPTDDGPTIHPPNQLAWLKQGNLDSHCIHWFLRDLVHQRYQAARSLLRIKLVIDREEETGCQGLSWSVFVVVCSGPRLHRQHILYKGYIEKADWLKKGLHEYHTRAILENANVSRLLLIAFNSYILSRAKRELHLTWISLAPVFSFVTCKNIATLKCSQYLVH